MRDDRPSILLIYLRLEIIKHGDGAAGEKERETHVPEETFNQGCNKTLVIVVTVTEI